MANLGWGFPFPNIVSSNKLYWINGEQYGHTGWIRPGSNTDFHDGFDFGASWYNGNVLAVHPGTVHKIGADLGWWYVWVQSPDGYSEIYQEGFTRRSDIFVNEGQQVAVGTPIGRVTGTHTHLGITNKPISVAYYHGFMDDGTWLDPIETIKQGMLAGGSSTAQPQGQQQTKTVTEDHSAEFIADAKKYLGVPYVWGGHNEANPWAGMDCAGYVNQVYHDWGIELGTAYTPSQERHFREIPYSEVTTGDVAFFGPHGATHHIELMLDHNTAIYEPQPGMSCMMQPIAQYPATWYGRNDEMHAKIFPVKTVPSNISTSNDNSSSSTQESYYFQPFIVQDNHSIEMWGLHPGEDVQDDRFKDPESMKKYALTQLVPDPVISIEVVTDKNIVPVPGEEAYLTIPERGTLISETSTTQTAYNTTVTAVGFTFYPYDPSQGTDITYDNLQASILHAQAYSTSLKRMEQLANAMLDRMPEVYYTKKDPSTDRAIKPGAMWANPYSINQLKEKEGGSGGRNNGTTSSGKPGTGNQSSSTTNSSTA